MLQLYSPDNAQEFGSMNRLPGKVAFISGAGGGMGRNAAFLFASEGAAVIIGELREEAGRQTESEIVAAGGAGYFVQTDVSDPESVSRAVEAGVNRFGKLDVLYNNAGGSTTEDRCVTEAPVEEFWRAIKLDLFGTWNCCKYAIPHLVRNRGGSVINVASMVALMGWPGKDAYTCAKGGIVALTRSMAVEYGRDNIRVNALAPGVVGTERTRKRLVEGSMQQRMLERQVLGLVQPSDVAQSALFLASDESRSITGHILTVDGGVTVS